MVFARYDTLVRPYRAQLRLAVRVTIAAILAMVIAQGLRLPMTLWAVLTAMVVTQMSVGRSLKATIDYLSGTLVGATLGLAVSVVVPHQTETGVLAAIGLVVAPLSLVAAFSPSFAIAPATAVIVILLPIITHATTLTSALDRVLEVVLGGAVGLVVSFVILPSNAHRLAIEAAARTLDQMALTLRALFRGLENGLEIEALHRLQDHLGWSLARLDVIGAEAERERSARLARRPVIQPLLSCLLRLRHDLVMIGRLAVRPLPDLLLTRLHDPLTTVEAAMAAFERASGSAIMGRGPPPDLDAVEAALSGYGEQVAALRHSGLTLDLSEDEAERFFALGFVLEQMRGNFQDLRLRVTEWTLAEPA